MIPLFDFGAVNTARPLHHAENTKWLLHNKIRPAVYQEPVHRIVGAGNQVLFYRAGKLLPRAVRTYIPMRAANHIHTLFKMQLARFSIREAAIVVEAVGDITVLLSFKNQCPALDRMHRARKNLEEISFFYRNHADQIFKTPLLNHLLQFFLALCMVADHDLRVLITIKDIPAFRFPE